MKSNDIYEIIKPHLSERPVNIEAVIRALGIELDKKANLNSAIAGQIQKLSDGKYKISVNKAEHYFRQRFTMAHELGHYIFHRPLIGDGVDDDKLYRSTEAGDFYNTKIQQYHETEANKFAASILMPAPLVKKDWDENPDLKYLANLWQVSPSAMKIRLKSLRILSD